MRPTLALSLLLTASSCAYYNGLYNARGLVRRAESAAREGRDSAAMAAWREAAAKADTVVARYPRSRWTDDALLLSGASAAFAGQCARGLERLGDWERHPDADQRQRARASIARGACLVRLGDVSRALDTLAPFVRHRETTLGRIAAAWAARAALASGRPDSAVALAVAAASDALDAELATAAIASNRPVLAARILRQRAPQWRALSGMHTVLEVLARSHRATADTIVQLAWHGRASRLERARLMVLAGSWAERAGDVVEARGVYARALRLSADTGLVADVVTRLGLMDVRTAFTIGEAQTRLEQARAKTVENAALTRVDSVLRLVSRLSAQPDSSGASLFLAAEVARDGAGAQALARRLFLDAARTYPSSSLAPKALLAAADLSPDSASTWRETVRTRYAGSPYAQALDGRLMTAPIEADERLLRQAWARAIVVADSASIATERRVP